MPGLLAPADPANRFDLDPALLLAMGLADDDDVPAMTVEEAARALVAAEDVLIGPYMDGDRYMSLGEAMGRDVEAAAEERLLDAWQWLRDALAAVDERRAAA